MRYIFKPSKSEMYDWWEKTDSTPSYPSDTYLFAMGDFRRWMLKWVFK